jgi:hypothetical protein
MIRPQAVAGTWAALVLVTASGLSVADRAGLHRHEDRAAVSRPRITRG